jgi:WD40 repeat protein
VKVLPPKAGPKPEPPAENLIASLVHPDRKAIVSTAVFSPGGDRLLSAGYPSGIIQVWDVAARKELRRIDILPAQARQSSDYALVTADWKRLYIPVATRTVQTIERDGKRGFRSAWSGEIRVWDLASAQEKEPLRAGNRSAPKYAWLAPDGRALVSAEQQGSDSAEAEEKMSTVVWDLASGTRRQFGDGLLFGPSFAADGKTVVAVLMEQWQTGARKTTLKVLDFPAGKELASVPCHEKGRQFSDVRVSPDGQVVAVWVVPAGRTKGDPMEVWFRDARTLADRGKLIGKSDAASPGLGRGLFTPDGKRFVAVDTPGNVFVWDVAGQKLERTLQAGRGWFPWPVALAPDRKTLAVPSMPPPRPGAGVETLFADPQDLPQPRIVLLDILRDAPPRIWMAPHGQIGAMAFSPDGRTLALGSSGVVHLFDMRAER